MSSTIYNKAFELQLSHLFYTAAHKFNVNQQLEIFATSATSELVKKGRMRMVRTGAGLDVFYQAYLDSAPAIPVVKPLIELSDPLEFVFALAIKKTDTSFLNVTDLDQGGTYQSGNIFFLDGNMPAVPPATTPINLIMSDSLIDQLRPSVFTYTFLPTTGGLTGDLELNVYPKGSITSILTIDPVLADPATGIYSAQIDLSAQPVGIYTIKVTDPNNGDFLENEADVYIDSELASQSIFGIIRIRYTDPEYFYKGLPDNISYEFEAREIKWRYYIAIKSVPAGFFTNHTLQIKDSNDPANPPFYTFTPLDGGGIPNGTVQVNGYPTVIITSSAVIPFSETAIARFNLLQNNPVNPVKTLMSSLANAATSGVDSNNVGVTGEKYAEIFLFLDQVSDP